MEENVARALKLMSRSELEVFALRAAVHIRLLRDDGASGNTFLVLLTGFLLGAAVAASGFLFGFGLG